jgi:glycosyltransferase involved in cell wall biosynthesis
MTKEELQPVLKQFSEQLQKHDILHIQHEFSFYSKDELYEFVLESKRQNKPIIVTVHTSLHAGIPKLDTRKLLSSGPRTLLGHRRLRNYLINVHVLPIKSADLVLVHNTTTGSSLAKYGVDKSRIKHLTMPVPVLDFKLESDKIARLLNKKQGDIILCTVGFLSENKGMRDALKALKDLPENYKLAMIGGRHPSGANDAFCNEMEQLIKDLGLEKRAVITGYVKDDEKLNAMIRECDICVYPFNPKYYAGVTSASLNNSLANYVPAVTYPTTPILQMNAEMPAVVTSNDFNHKALAEAILNLDLEEQSKIAKRYAQAFAYDKQAREVIDIYLDLKTSN